MSEDDLSQLPLEQKASLLSGASMQETKALPEAGIPAIVLCDGPYGVRFVKGSEAGASEWGTPPEPATCFPPAAAVGCSWDPAVAGQLGAGLAREARAYGVGVNLGPAMNIKRSPLCGRNFEYYSEDPLLTGALAGAYVQAVERLGVATSPKHFAANNQETWRMQVSADVDERTLREIYLRPFELVVTQAKPTTIMAAYNRVNGIPATENEWLLRQILRDEWDFEGVVVSDWAAVSDRIAALRAGLDLEMPGTSGYTDGLIVQAVRSGALDEGLIDESALRVAALARRAAPPTGAFDADAHHLLARKLASQCAVLLKNERQTLPLSPATHIAVIGMFASSPRFQGGGSSHLNPTRVDAALPAIEALAKDAGCSVVYAEGFTLDSSGDTAALGAAAVAAAQSADIAVIFAGLPEPQESEGTDRANLDLPAEQVDVIRAVAAVAPRTVVVLSHGGAVVLEGWHDAVDAILDGFLLGQASGSALADLLFGVTNPSGHLAETIPLRLQDNPSFVNFPGEQGHVRYGEGIFVGYRYYASADKPVRYAFGHGLSYTTFETTDLSAIVRDDESVDVTVTVTNSGERAGQHVIQVYVATQAGPVRRPLRELRAFRKVALEPGESRSITMVLDRRAFSYYDVVRGQWLVAAGEYRIQVCRNACDVEREEAVVLGGDVVTSKLAMNSSVEEWFGHPVAGPLLIQKLMERANAAQAENLSGLDLGQLFSMIGSMPMRLFALFPGVDLPLEQLEALLAKTN